MNDKVIDALAEYFTGPSVTFYSMALSLGTAHARYAERFFAARDMLGLFGYPNKEAAVKSIKETLK